MQSSQTHILQTKKRQLRILFLIVGVLLLVWINAGLVMLFLYPEILRWYLLGAMILGLVYRQMRGRLRVHHK